MGLRHDIAVYFGLADEPPEERHALQAALVQTSVARLLLNTAVGALVASAVVGLIRCLLDGETVTVARVMEKGGWWPSSSPLRESPESCGTFAAPSDTAAPAWLTRGVPRASG